MLSLPVRYLQGIAAKHTDLPASAMLALPELLSNPLAVIPHKDGGYRMVLEAKSANGDPIVAGISQDGRIQTVFPRVAADLKQEAERALGTVGAKVYARNKEALTEIRASRGVPIGSQGPNQSASTGAAPATIALHRSPRDRAIVGRLTPEWTQQRPAIGRSPVGQRPCQRVRSKSCSRYARWSTTRRKWSYGRASGSPRPDRAGDPEPIPREPARCP